MKGNVRSAMHLPTKTRIRPASAAPSPALAATAAAIATAFTVVIFACGGGSKPIAAVPGAGDGGADGSGAARTSGPLGAPSGLPPMAPMPPPGVAGSKKGKTRDVVGLYACSASLPLRAKDPEALVKQLGEACAAASKTHAVGAPIRGQQSDKDPKTEQKIRVDANKCYRVYFATDENVRDAVLVIRDSAGDIVAEAPAPVLPDSGVVCFNTADEVSLLLSVGAGKGAYAAQVWSD